jgi:hypothetical protein
MLQADTQLINDQTFGSLTTSNALQHLDPLQSLANFQSSSPSASTIAFIDAGIADALAVIENAQADVTILLDSTQDGIAQVSKALTNYRDLTGIHFVSHGDVGELRLGNSTLSASTLGQYGDDLQAWAAALSPDGDILFHGCNVAAGDLGQTFVKQVSRLTTADVAASTDLTGNSHLGGDWVLEYATGNIETQDPFTADFKAQYEGLLNTSSLFDPTDTPSVLNANDGSGSRGDYELGMEFQSARNGTISAIRYYKAPSETGTHVGRIWSASGQLLAQVTFTNETASGWQEQALSTPLSIQANTTYVVSVNVNSHYAITTGGLATSLTNGDITAVADGSNGVFNTTPGGFPTQSWNNSNYYRDIVFTAATSSAENNPGNVTIGGLVEEDQTLTASVTDDDGLTNANVNYQWQQSSDDGTTWSNIAGATSDTVVLGDDQVNQLIRVNAAYVDNLGNNETQVSAPTAAVANLNDLGTVTITGTAALGSELSATVTDDDGLSGTITYQWQSSSDGSDWTNITDAIGQTLVLGSSLEEQQVRVAVAYTDAFGTNETPLSPPTAAITAALPSQSLFDETLTPATLNATDGGGDYELGMEFQSARNGTISAIRYYKAPSETGTHVGRIWSASGQLLAQVTFTNETASGWQEQALSTPLSIQANTTYVVSVNVNSHYAITTGGLATSLTNGDITAVADGSNGVFNTTPGGFPTQSWNNSNYYRDIVFTAATSSAENNPGNVTIGGLVEEDQTLTASVTDDDGLTNANVNYQWQQSSDDGTTWSNIAGATSDTVVLGDDQVNQLIRVNAAYVDNLGNNETQVSAPTAAVANLNDLGTVTITGTAALGSELSTTVTDDDGLSGTITYQWQSSSDGSDWTNITDAIGQTLVLGSSLKEQQVRVAVAYTDAFGTNETPLSPPTAAITAALPSQSLFDETLTPATLNATDGGGDYELGMEFQSARNGTISAIRYYKAPSETGTHVGRIWSASGQLLAQVTFTNETASGWQEQALSTPLSIQANTTYVVSVNVNSHYAITTGGLATSLTNGDITAVADGSNGVFNTTPGGFPTQSWNNSNYYRDIVFTAATSSAENNPGNVTIGGLVEEDQTLTASVTDDDGLTNANVNYQWQQSSDDGTTWSNIAGATSDTVVLGDDQVNQLIRVNAAYVDNLGNNETQVSAPTAAVANLNDLGTVTITGTAALGSELSATVTDDDGLSGTITYQWQSSSDGSDWTNITDAIGQTLVLSSSLKEQQVRVAVAYTDAFGTNETPLSPPTAAITAALPSQSLFEPTNTPLNPDSSDNGEDWELGMRFISAARGQITAIRYYKAPSETGTHVGRIWSGTGQLLAEVTFTNETASGWQEQALPTPLNIQENTSYVVSVNANDFYASSNGGFDNPLTNVDLTAGMGAGRYNATVGAFPTGIYQNENYFRDIVFVAMPPNPNNTPGTVNITGTAAEDQVLTAKVTDDDGLDGVTVSYQWQQSRDNGATWDNIAGATSDTFALGDDQVNQLVRVSVTYYDALNTRETLNSSATNPVANVNDEGFSILKGSATVGHELSTTIFDADGLAGADINYQWQQFVDNSWSDIIGATSKSLEITTALLDLQVRVLASYMDNLGSSETVASSQVTIAAQNAIVLENQKTGTTNWRISPSDLAINDEITGFASATSINKGEALDLKISLTQSGQYQIDVYRLGYYAGTGGRLVTSATGLNGVSQSAPTFDSSTRLVEYQWNTSYTLQTSTDWTTGLYLVKLTDNRTGKQNHIPFVLRDDNRPANIGFQDAVTTAQAYNNYGEYSVYNFNSKSGQRANKVSFNRPYNATHLGLTNTNGLNNNAMLTWEYNMVRWLESQGYDVSYYDSLDVHRNPFQLYSQKTYLSVGHDEYWSMEMRNNIEQARDKGINLAFFSANTGYWRIRLEPSPNGQANGVMTVYKDSSGIGINGDSRDPAAEFEPSAATTLFRSPQVNRPENALLGVGLVGITSDIYGGYDFIVTNASDPYYAYTGLQNGDSLGKLVGFEWDGLLNNGLAPENLVVLSQSPVPTSGGVGILPPGTNVNISNAVRYTADSGAKVFSTGTIQWAWALDSDGVTNPRVDTRAQQMAVNIFSDMGALPTTPDNHLINPRTGSSFT